MTPTPPRPASRGGGGRVATFPEAAVTTHPNDSPADLARWADDGGWGGPDDFGPPDPAPHTPLTGGRLRVSTALMLRHT